MKGKEYDELSGIVYINMPGVLMVSERMTKQCEAPRIEKPTKGQPIFKCTMGDASAQADKSHNNGKTLSLVDSIYWVSSGWWDLLAI